MKSKTCKSCRKEKVITEFSKHPTAKFGVSNTCKPCAKELAKKYRDASPTKYKEKERLRNKSPERIEQRKKWEEANREKRREQERARDTLNRDEVNAKQRDWRKRNPDKEKANTLRWREKNRESIREKSRIQSADYRKNNPDKVVASTHRYRKRIVENGGSFTGEDWAQIKLLARYTCLSCGKTEPEIKLSPDHVIPISKGGLNDKSNIQPLCLKCNRMKSDKSTDYRISS